MQNFYLISYLNLLQNFYLYPISKKTTNYITPLNYLKTYST